MMLYSEDELRSSAVARICTSLSQKLAKRHVRKDNQGFKGYLQMTHIEHTTATCMEGEGCACPIRQALACRR
jgi:hypothetical protein